MGSELKPCPLCGDDQCWPWNNPDDQGERWGVCCDGCGCEVSSPDRTKAGALAAWNRRSEPRGDDSPLAPEGAPQLASGGNRDPGPSSAAGAWVTVPREPTEAMADAYAEEMGTDMVIGFRDAYRAMIASAPKAEVEGWRPIESAKRDGSPVLLWYPGLPTNELQIGQWRSYASEWGDLGDWIDPETGDVIETVGGPVEPTHWRPLPAPPATRDGADEPHLVEASTEREARSHTDSRPDPLVIVKPRRKG